MTASNGKHPQPSASHSTRAHREAFLAAFAKCGLLGEAARAAGVNRSTVWRWRQDDEEFAKAFDVAEQESFELLVNEARRRGIEGYDEYVVTGKGLVFGEDGKPLLQRRFSDGLLKFLIERREGKPVQTIEHKGELTKPDDLKPQYVAEVLRELDRLGSLAPREDSAV